MLESVESRTALRTSLCVMTTALIAFATHLPAPYWSCMTVIVVSQKYTGEIIQKGTMRLLGTLVGAVLGYVLAGLLANSFYLFLTANFFIVAVGYYTHRQSNYPYAVLLCMITTVLISAEVLINPQAPFYTALWRPIEIGLGVIVATMGAVCVLPNHGESELEDVKQRVLTALMGLCETLIKGRPMDEKTLLIKELRQAMKESRELISAMSYELGPRRLAQLRLSQRTMRRLMLSLITINQQVDDAILPLLHHMKAHNMLHQLQCIIKALKENQTLDKGLTQELDSSIQQVEKRYLKMRHLDKLRHVQSAPLGQFHALLNHFKTLNARLADTTPLTFHPKALRIRRDPDAIKQSIKAGLSAVLALLMWIMSGWPSGIQGIISSFVIMLRRNTDEMNQIAMQRFAGCLVGASIALLALSLVPMQWPVLLSLLFVVIGPFQYCYLSLKKNNYLFLQANFALVITLLQAFGPPTSLGPPLERLSGILIGITASLLVANGFWRQTRQSYAQNRLNKLFTLLLDNLKKAPYQTKCHDLSPLITSLRSYFDKLPSTPENDRLRMILEHLVSIQRLIKLNAFLLTPTLNQAAQTLDLSLETIHQELMTHLEELQEKRLTPDPKHSMPAVLQQQIDKARQHPMRRQINSVKFNELMAYFANMASCFED